MKIKNIIAPLLLIALIALAGCASKTSNIEGGGQEISVFKSPNCGCCNGHVSAYEQAGFSVDVNQMSNMDGVKAQHNIPSNMLSCHTAVVGDYFVEGHVPIEAVEKLLSEKPDIDGIALPGMPAGSPGMPGAKRGTWTIYAIKDGEVSEFMKI